MSHNVDIALACEPQSSPLPEGRRLELSRVALSLSSSSGFSSVLLPIQGLKPFILNLRASIGFALGCQPCFGLPYSTHCLVHGPRHLPSCDDYVFASQVAVTAP